MLRKLIKKKVAKVGDTITVFTSWPLSPPKNGAPHKANTNTKNSPSQDNFVALHQYYFQAPQHVKNAMIIKHLVIASEKIHCGAFACGGDFSRHAA